MTLAVATTADADALSSESKASGSASPPHSPPWRADELARAAGAAAAVTLGVVVAVTGGVPLRAHPPAATRSAPFDYPWVDSAAAAATTTTTAAAAARRWSAWALYTTHQVGHWALIWVTTSKGGGSGCGRRPRRRSACAQSGPTVGDDHGGRQRSDGDCPKMDPTGTAPPAAAPATASASATKVAGAAAVPPDAHRLRWWHGATLGLHATFCVARVAHTRWVSYDGLARDVHEASALGAVAVLLVWVWLLRSPERGVFFGCFRLSLPGGGGSRAAATLRSAAVAAHSYAFSFACVWTLWYHPAVATPAHVTGIVYIGALLVQSALAGTAAHVEEGWMTALEVSVAGHALVTAAAATTRSASAAAAAGVAVAQPGGGGGGGDGGKSLLPLFGWGFASTFVAVPLHGLGWSAATRARVTAAYGATAAAAVAGRWGGTRAYHVVAIPVADAVILGVLVAVLGGGNWAAIRLRAWRRRSQQYAAAARELRGSVPSVCAAAS